MLYDVITIYHALITGTVDDDAALVAASPTCYQVYIAGYHIRQSMTLLSPNGHCYCFDF